jgi:hypothetical protein
MGTICQVDLSADLTRIADLFEKSLGNACVKAPLADGNPDKAGLQLDCTVEDVVDTTAIPIESCDEDASARPCWQLQSDPVTCSGFLNLKLVVQRGVDPAPTAITRLRCLVE